MWTWMSISKSEPRPGRFAWRTVSPLPPPRFTPIPPEPRAPQRMTSASLTYPSLSLFAQRSRLRSPVGFLSPPRPDGSVPDALRLSAFIPGSQAAARVHGGLCPSMGGCRTPTVSHTLSSALPWPAGVARGTRRPPPPPHRVAVCLCVWGWSPGGAARCGGKCVVPFCEMLLGSPPGHRPRVLQPHPQHVVGPF